jgi:DNA-directed RNA polymerase subunit H (RpoH/RPB5)
MDDKVIISLTEEEARHLIAMLHIEGFHEKRELPKSLHSNRTDISKNMGKVIKKVRKALESK